MDIAEIRKGLAQRIASLELEIRMWGTHNSQSNPGAVMELRSMKKELAAAYKEFHASIVLAAATRKPGEDSGLTAPDAR